MPFDVQNKVAIITGAGAGIGFLFAKELLSNGLRGVTIVDINEDLGKKSTKALCDEYGANKAIFVKADVASDQEFEEIFKKTHEQFQNIDILVNNAAIIDERNWSREFDVNLKGVIRGTLLGMDYLSKYKTGDDGLIVNMSSVGGLGIYPGNPFYTTSKLAILRVSQCLGHTAHYERTKVQVVIACPGLTNTALASDGLRKLYSPEYQEMFDKESLKTFKMQEPSHVSKELIGIIKIATTGSVWVIENGEEAYEIEFPAILGTKKQ